MGALAVIEDLFLGQVAAPADEEYRGRCVQELFLPRVDDKHPSGKHPVTSTPNEVDFDDKLMVGEEETGEADSDQDPIAGFSKADVGNQSEQKKGAKEKGAGTLTQATIVAPLESSDTSWIGSYSVKVMVLVCTLMSVCSLLSESLRR